MEQHCVASQTLNNPLTISTLATLFSVAGVAIGAPSLSLLVLSVIWMIRLRRAPEIASASVGNRPDAILLMLKGIAATVAALGRFSESLGKLLLQGLAIFAVVGLIVGVACWFTGRGLHAQANWARFSAFILIALAMPPSLLLAVSLHKVGRVLMLGIVTLCAFGIHTLWMGYAPQTH
jgi:hypothetical protein